MPEIDLDKLYALIDVLQMQRNQASDACAQVQADLICAQQEIHRLKGNLKESPKEGIENGNADT